MNRRPAAQRQRRLLSQRPRPHLQPPLRAHAAGRAQDQGQDDGHHRDAVQIQGAQIQVRIEDQSYYKLKRSILAKFSLD